MASMTLTASKEVCLLSGIFFDMSRTRYYDVLSVSEVVYLLDVCSVPPPDAQQVGA